MVSREMKDSGVEWIGKIPKEWQIKRNKFIATSLLKGNGITKEQVFEDGNVRCIRYGEIYSKYDRYFDNTFSKTNIDAMQKPRFIKYGDILFAGTGELIEEIGKNIVYLGSEECLAGGDIIIMRHKQNPRFLNYALNSSYSQTQKSSSKAKLKVVHISSFDIGNLLIVLPSISEQEAIANFLDSKCAEIDALTADIEKQIETLQEYKNSVITEAVTKGLKKSVQTKETEIDIIGAIPISWKTKRLKFLCSITTGDSDTQDSNPDGEYPFYVRSPVVERSDHYSFVGEAILMAGDGAGAGRIFHYANGKMAIHQRVYCLHSFKEIVPRYLFYFIGNRFCCQMDKGSAQSTVPSVRLPMLKNFTIALPPEFEQQKIVNFLDAKCAEIEAIIAQKQDQLSNLAEYKKSIIYEYVTGKKTVPNA